MPAPPASQPESESGSRAGARSPTSPHASDPFGGASEAKGEAYRDLVIPCVLVTWVGDTPLAGEPRPAPGGTSTESSVRVTCSQGARALALHVLGGEDVFGEWASAAAFEAALASGPGCAEATRSLARCEGAELQVRLIPRRVCRASDAAEVHRWLVEVVDETRHEERARAGARAQGVLERLIETMPMALFTKDPKDNFRFARVNRSFEETFGLRREDVVGGFDSDFFDDDELIRKYREDDVAVFRDAQVRVIDEEIATPIGRRQARTIKVPMFDEDGNPELLLGILQDVTDFRRALRDAEQARRLKSQFLRGLGREIATRLGVIVDELEGAGSQTATARTEARELLACVLEGLELEARERRIDGHDAPTEDVNPPGTKAQLGRDPDAGAVHAPAGVAQVVDPEKPLRGALEDVRASADVHGITLEFESERLKCADENVAPPTVRFAEPDRVQEALRQLLSNAIQFSPRGSNVHGSVEIDSERRRLRYVVRDEGIGIPKDEQSFLFGSFRSTGRQPASRRQVGLGLTLVQKIVDYLGGSIAVHSEIGTGSVFTLEVPCSVAGVGPRPAHAGASSLAPARILVADDNVAYQRILRRRLEGGGHSVNIVDNSQDALATVRSRGATIDFVLVDLQMSGTSGSDFLTDLCAERKEHGIAIVALSARGPEAEERERNACLRAGADAWFAKPIRAGELERALAAIDRRTV